MQPIPTCTVELNDRWELLLVVTSLGAACRELLLVVTSPGAAYLSLMASCRG